LTGAQSGAVVVAPPVIHNDLTIATIKDNSADAPHCVSNFEQKDRTTMHVFVKIETERSDSSQNNKLKFAHLEAL